MARKLFGINPDKRDTVPTGLQREGVAGGNGIFDKYFNQVIFEQNQDRVIGTAAQLALNDCTLKYDSSEAVVADRLKDKDDNIVLLDNDDRVYIIGLDTLTSDFDLSAYDRLRVISDPSITLDNSSQDFIFGDDCFFDVNVSNIENFTTGNGRYGFVNRFVFPGFRQYLEGTDFTITVTGATLSSIIRAVGIPYQTSDVAWRYVFNYDISLSPVDAGFDLHTSGITFKTGVDQAVVAFASTTDETNGIAVQAADYITLTNNTNLRSGWRISGDVELDSKPTWAQ